MVEEAFLKHREGMWVQFTPQDLSMPKIKFGDGDAPQSVPKLISPALSHIFCLN